VGQSGKSETVSLRALLRVIAHSAARDKVSDSCSPRTAARLRELLDVGEVDTTRIDARRPHKKKERRVE
jgi:hypothetical protein